MKWSLAYYKNKMREEEGEGEPTRGSVSDTTDGEIEGCMERQTQPPRKSTTFYHVG